MGDHGGVAAHEATGPRSHRADRIGAGLSLDSAAVALLRRQARHRGFHDRSNVHVTVVHLPAVNTPQFSWCRTRLPRHPAPVGQIFEPEVAARAAYWAAHNRRREVFVGMPTVTAIYGQEVAPGFADQYLGQTGYESQQTDPPVSPDRPDNMFETVPGPYGARGIFSGKAKSASLQNWANLHRGVVSAIGAGIAGAAAFALPAGIPMQNERQYSPAPSERSQAPGHSTAQ